MRFPKFDADFVTNKVNLVKLRIERGKVKKLREAYYCFKWLLLYDGEKYRTIEKRFSSEVEEVFLTPRAHL